MSTCKVACAGFGNRLQHVLKMAMASPHGVSLEITDIFDPDPAVAEAARDLAPAAQLHDSWESCLAETDAEWAAIGSWNCFHRAQILAALEAGKHVFCEKPLATTLEDCVAVARALREHPDRQFFFGLVLRYSPHYQKLHELLRAGTIGRLVSFEFNETLAPYHGAYIHGNWRRKREWAGTHLLEKCCHDFDLANWLVDSLPVHVASFGGLSMFQPQNAALLETIDDGSSGRRVYELWKTPGDIDPFNDDKDIVDHQVAILEYDNGVRATFHTNCNAAIPERRMYFCGTEGVLRADVLTGEISLRRTGAAAPERHDTGSSGGHGGADDIMSRALAETMTTGKAPLASITEALQSAVACLGVDQALDQRKVVDLEALWAEIRNA